MKQEFREVISGFAAGLMITVGAAVFLSCEIRYIGALLFAVALLCICMKGYNLFTGRVGYVPQDHSKKAVSALLLGLLGNAIGCILFGSLLRLGLPALGAAAEAACTNRLSQTFIQTLIRGFFCGLLMYLAVSIYKEKHSVLGIVFCIPVFILSGFEHSVADICYFAVSGIVSLKAFGFIMTVVLGNSLGAMLLPFLKKALEKKDE